MDTVVLLDTDIPVFKVAAQNQETVNFGGEDIISAGDFDQACDQLDATLDNYMDRLNGDRLICALSEPDRELNWRKQYLSTYKFNRSKTPSPIFRQPLSDYVEQKYECFKRPTLEGDDVLGILATHPTMIEGMKIIVSEDKDMKTIPSMHGRNMLWNPEKDQFGPREISIAEANHFWMLQTLMGDSTDGYKGCPMIGPAKGLKILGDVGEFTLKEMWARVVETYEAATLKGVSRGLGEADATVQAQVARICRSNNYDFKAHEVIAWVPENLVG
jgi:5'-3' exonuclease